MNNKITHLPRLMISATGSGSGKTTITCAILRALLEKKLQPTAFKCGPDYIDPMFHSRVIGAASRNLDLFMLGADKCKYLLAKNSSPDGISILEGVMGYYDGVSTSTQASSYELAKTTATPVILLVNAKGAALSIAATIKGFMQFRTDSNIQGVILNNITQSVFEFYKHSLEAECGIPMLGYFPPLPVEDTFASRHLGLVTAAEIDNLREIADRLAATASQTLDWDRLLSIARQAPNFEYTDYQLEPLADVKIAVAQDKAFCFYYQDSLQLLRDLGAELIEFSPLADKKLPKCDGIYLGGGYPELYAAQLSSNIDMRTAIKQALAGGLPCIAECGGFMYLNEAIEQDKQLYPMVGSIQSTATMGSKLTRFGYITLTSKTDNLLANTGEQINAHEFHYSDSTNNGADFSAAKPLSKRGWECIHADATLFAGYPHIHLWGNIEFARRFILKCQEYSATKHY